MTKNAFSRAAIILLSVWMLFSSVQVANGGIVAITDINTHWAKKVINSWIEKGFTNGYNDNTFRPDKTITRAEFIVLINRSFGFSEKADITFTDAKDKDWYYADVAKAVKAGYITGCSETAMCPNKEITRREAAVMISRLLRLGDTVAGDSSMFEDSYEFADWGYDEIGIAATTLIMTGYLDAASGSTSFKANNKIKRAEAIVSLDRALTYKNNNFNLAGLYGPTTGVKTIEGDVTIKVSGVVLQNMVINGNLVISDQVAEGDATLKNVIIKKSAIINGGGVNSIHLENTTIDSLVVNKPTGAVRVVAEGTTRITNTTVQSTATLEEAIGIKSSGFQTVTMSGSESGAASAVTLSGAFDKINLNGQSIQMTIPIGSVQTMVVSEEAVSNSLNISAGVTLNALVLNTQMTFTGQGTIQNATLSDSAIDSPFEKQPSIRKNANGAIILPAAPPVFTSVVAVNSGNNVGLGVNDSIVITFDQNTNKPTITAANLITWFTINSGHSFGSNLLNTDISWNATGNILTIYLSNVTGTTFVVGDTVRVLAAANLKNSTGSTVASVAISAPSTGSFTSAPVISSVVANNTGNNDGLGVGDSVVITFDQNTNRPPIKAATLNAMLVLNNGHSFGNLLDRDIYWNSTGNILTITFSNITATTFTQGDTVTVTANATISSQGGNVFSNSTSGVSTGSFTSYLEIKSIVAANVGVGRNVGLSVGDTVAITFSTATSHPPVITAANFKTWFANLNGHSWGTNLTDNNIKWTNSQVLTITFSDVTGATIVPGDIIFISESANIRDVALKYKLNHMVSQPMTGSFSDAPAISSIVASNSGNNAGLGIGDSVIISFNQPTNKPYLAGSIINSLLVLSGGHSFGTALVDSNIYWNTAGDVLTINFNNITNVTFAVGDTITLTKAANIKDALLTSQEAVTMSSKSTGSFSPLPATPSVVSVVASNTGNATGLNKGDNITITFNQSTNGPTITDLKKWFIVNSGADFGTGSSTSWNSSKNALTITFNTPPDDLAKYIKIGDIFQVSAEANIKDDKGLSLAYTGFTTALTGSFSSAPTIKTVMAKDYGNVGLSYGDWLEITFSEATNRPLITPQNLKDWLVISNNHSFGSGLTEYDITWDTTNTILSITFNDITDSSIQVGDTIHFTSSAKIMDSKGEVNVSEAISLPISGTFTSPPKIIDFLVSSNTPDDNFGAGDTITIVFDQLTNKPIVTANLLNRWFSLKNSSSDLIPKFPESFIRSISWSTMEGQQDCLNIVLSDDIGSSNTSIVNGDTYIDFNTKNPIIIKDDKNSIQGSPKSADEQISILNGSY
ncbi:S-layer homology domain-containing protein [Paenibacillus psychroresistens]|uniref:S-layer homology domain-containing protein n=1 Tax=Paenibacillus psychroresistens TaxID=1778678 RepID=A0A6B8RNQ2_9BACL|nr:S-layer homology domain-containing protein [Paenibacillus psychroresistens]QGQ97960.1 S-layer homology domain-containing protein [Paenibacillus psychroresistens]